MDTTKLTAFAQAVGADVKEVKQSVSTKVETSAMTQAISQAVTQAKSEVKAEILGESVPENLDTLKEIAEKNHEHGSRCKRRTSRQSNRS